MFSLFRKKPAKSPETTFKKRVQLFWEWYAQVSPRFYEVIEAGKCPSLADEVSAKIDELIPGFAWVFGPGAEGKGHSFTLSGEGNLHRQLLTIYWLAQAPSLPGWTFYAYRQPGSIKGSAMKIGDQRFDPREFWIAPSIDAEEVKVDITVWHPLFDTMAERDRWTVLLLFLDQVLGEYGTGQWVGKIKFSSDRLADSIPLEEFPDFIRRLQTEREWKKLPPGERAVLYRSKEPHNRFLRGDILGGSTMHPQLINEYLAAEGELDDPLSGTGADDVFVAFDRRRLPAGSEVAARGEIEDALDHALRTSANGRLLGGAIGIENAYIDLLLFDGPESLGVVTQILRQHPLTQGSSINYFAKEKRGHRIIV
jgi:hypothetical protein